MKIVLLQTIFLCVILHSSAQNVTQAVYATEHPFRGTGIASLTIFEKQSVYVDSNTVGSTNKSVNERVSPTLFRKGTLVRFPAGMWSRHTLSSGLIEAHEEIKEEVFFVSDTLQPKWQLTDETKQLGTLQCKKAIALFRGRTWYAYYAPEIPVPTGPWKFRGLPGLVVEATDSTRHHTFTLIEIRLLPLNEVSEIAFPVYGKVIGFKDYWEIYNSQIKAAAAASELRAQELMREHPGVVISRRASPTAAIEVSEY